ncbi:ATP-binding protein [Actinoplanes sp. NBRC 103695]|uniref:sensor histidine kinase n=1 Tax=Actinoplanes sp. NBRC 103695 TaxID=3032202 RepID=UPI0024A443DC|nr:ATP-binding protein [Actinoplanes sp. NBRC 103695]GLY99161.1 hypothetical protein Acsp02_64150 [Actinoplanes sp. NBRC 103695]
MLRSITGRVRAAVGVLLALFVALVLVQLLVSEQLQSAQHRHTERLGEARAANKAVLQHMTDAETGVRGFQLTGDQDFLAPYRSGKVAAFGAFDRVAELSADPEVRRLLTAERSAAAHWLYAYAVPTVNAGVADRDERLAARGKSSFDRIRVANASVDDALRAEQQSVTRGDRSRIRTAQLIFAGLAVAFLALVAFLAGAHRRHLLAPLERLLADEHARRARHEVRQQVAAELRSNRAVETTAVRVAELMAAAFGADEVHGRITAGTGAGVDVRWPTGAAPLPATTAAAVLDGKPGQVAEVADVPGGIAVALPGDSECPPGLLLVVRAHPAGWGEEERRLLGALAREIEHAVRQQRLHVRQARLINELRTLDERKDAFVATVTHELRTPLTSILGYTEMLTDDEDDLTPPQRRGLEAILRNALRLRDTVADLLLLDPGAQRAGGPPVPVDLAALTTTVVADVTAAAQAKGLTLTLEATPAWVAGEADRLTRAVRNLLDNAVKFTPAGGHVRCRIDAGPETASLEVTDTGIGVPAGDQPGLFTPFHRGANAMDQAVQGSGLGLAIVHDIVTEHGGAVSVRSASGEGSTFTVSLPVIPPSENPRPEREPIGRLVANQ